MSLSTSSKSVLLITVTALNAEYNLIHCTGQYDIFLPRYKMFNGGTLLQVLLLQPMPHIPLPSTCSDVYLGVYTRVSKNHFYGRPTAESGYPVLPPGDLDRRECLVQIHDWYEALSPLNCAPASNAYDNCFLLAPSLFHCCA